MNREESTEKLAEAIVDAMDLSDVVQIAKESIVDNLGELSDKKFQKEYDAVFGDDE